MFRGHRAQERLNDGSSTYLDGLPQHEIFLYIISQPECLGTSGTNKSVNEDI